MSNTISQSNDLDTMTRDELVAEVEQLRRTVAVLTKLPKGVRKNSEATLWGLPLLAIAFGPDPEKGEMHGHARGIIAIGDIATGVLAFGGLARGGLAVGGVVAGGVAIGGAAVGVIALGGVALSLLFAMGGLAIGAIAIGGQAIGIVAVGGSAMGYYACGGGATGVHVISPVSQSPEAVEFFGRFGHFIPGWKRYIGG